MSPHLKNLITILGLIGIAAFGYYLIVLKDGAVLPATGGATASNQAALESREFLNRLEELRKIEIDHAVFSDQRFSALKEFRTDLPRVQVGKPNPFAPEN